MQHNTNLFVAGQPDQDYNESDVEEIDETTKVSKTTTPTIANSIKVINPVFLKSKQLNQQKNRKQLSYDFLQQTEKSSAIDENFKLNDINENSNNSDNMVLPHDQVSCIRMSTNEMDIKITNKNPIIYEDCSYYDTQLTENANNWHQIVIFHNRKYTKQQILKTLFDVVSDSEFYPVAYRQTKFTHYFFIRICRAAIAKFFKSNLQFRMEDGGKIKMLIKLNVAEYHFGQIYPTKKLEEACLERFKHLTNHEGVTKVLDLSNLSECPVLDEIVVNLANKTTLTLLADTIANNLEIFKNINGIILSNNNINTLAQFSILPSFSVQLIDLRSNFIHSASQLTQLRKIQFTDLYVAKNPLTMRKSFVDEVKHIFPKLNRIDDYIIRRETVIVTAGTKTTPTTKTITNNPLVAISLDDDTFDIMFKGDKICANDKNDLNIFRKYKLSDMWHQIIIHHNGKFNKADIIKAIFNTLTSHEFYPCYYKCYADYDIFYVRLCYEQLEYLYAGKLLLKMPTSEEKIFMTFKMNMANFKTGQIDPNEQILNAISARFSYMDKCLNLENFSESPELKNVIVTLSNPRTMANILLLAARKFLINIVSLKLSKNEIQTTKGMHSLNWMKAIKSIDMSYNLIESISDLDTLPQTHINEVNLNGNPLCANYVGAFDYINDVRKKFPELEILDGQTLGADGDFIAHQNYLCSLDGYEIVEQFIQQYYNLFDSNERSSIKEFYHPNAILSMSINFNRVALSHENQIKYYILKSRNVLKMSNFGQAVNSILSGPEEICNLWTNIGKTKHDLKNFMIDMTFYSPETIIFTINGLYKEYGNTLNDEELILGFVRTFVLQVGTKNIGLFGNSTEYRIINEQVLIYRPSIVQLRKSFTHTSSIEKKDDEMSKTDKEGMLIIFQELTTLVLPWCIRCLEESDWHFKNALQLFTRLTETDKIPLTAFQFHKA